MTGAELNTPEKSYTVGFVNPDILLGSARLSQIHCRSVRSRVRASFHWFRPYLWNQAAASAILFVTGICTTPSFSSKEMLARLNKMLGAAEMSSFERGRNRIVPIFCLGEPIILTFCTSREHYPAASIVPTISKAILALVRPGTPVTGRRPET